MLFHGTGKVKPHAIYKDSDTGFDLQYAKSNGLYGSGLYFAVEASYSHNKRYAHRLGGAKFQVLLADVYIGKPYTGDWNEQFIKPPKGYDSVEQPEKWFYIIYSNFHSYPLYLFEYSIK